MCIRDSRKNSTDKAGMKRTAKMITMQKCQERWSPGTKGRWTTKIIKNLDAWINRKHTADWIQPNKRLQSYLHSTGRAARSICPHCGYEKNMPVSYTHLDVYKRQILTRPFCLAFNNQLTIFVSSYSKFCRNLVSFLIVHYQLFS